MPPTRGEGSCGSQSMRPARYTKQTIEFVYLGGAITPHRDLGIELTRRLQRTWGWFKRYNMEIYDRPCVRLQLKVRSLKAEVVETLLYDCMTWNPNKPDYDTGYGGFTTSYSSDASDGGNGILAITPYRTPTRLPRQLPRA